LIQTETDSLQALQTTGSERQRLRSRITCPVHRMEHDTPDSAAIEIQELEAVVDDLHLYNGYRIKDRTESLPIST